VRLIVRGLGMLISRVGVGVILGIVEYPGRWLPLILLAATPLNGLTAC